MDNLNDEEQGNNCLWNLKNIRMTTKITNTAKSHNLNIAESREMGTTRLQARQIILHYKFDT